VPDTAPKLFERVPRGLFGPLGDPYAELYWELLSALYQQEFEREPFVVIRQAALDIAEYAILASPLWAVRRQELEALAWEDDAGPNGTKPVSGRTESRLRSERPAWNNSDESVTVRALARRITARLERSGWIHFQYRAGLGEIMSFHPYAARFMRLEVVMASLLLACQITAVVA
jgi:hypothetical protein